MMRSRTAAAIVALIVLAGCSSEPEVSGNALLVAHNLDAMQAPEIIDHLDRLSVEDRPVDLMASVRVDELLLSDVTGEVSLDLPADRFYLSVAPYVNQTHDCHFHSLTTCQGELRNEKIQVTFTDDVGEVVVDEEMTTFDNGFIGLWLPRGLEGTLRVVSGEGGAGQIPVSTGDEAPTCLTTLALG